MNEEILHNELMGQNSKKIFKKMTIMEKKAQLICLKMKKNWENYILIKKGIKILIVMTGRNPNQERTHFAIWQDKRKRFILKCFPQT